MADAAFFNYESSSAALALPMKATIPIFIKYILIFG
jgi:hypothetical protein